MAVMNGVLEEEFDRLLRMRHAYIKEIIRLPIGYLSQKTINGEQYNYLQWREGTSIRSRYVKSDDVTIVKKQIKRRKVLEEWLLEVDKDIAFLKKPLKKKLCLIPKHSFYSLSSQPKE